MKVLRSDVLGFCMGVRRAVEIARAATAQASASLPDTSAQTSAPGKVYSLGPLIHNPRVLAELKAEGLEILEEPDDLQGASVIIRAHGISPQLEQAVRDRGGRIIDATCPRVKKNQLLAHNFEAAGVRLFIAGEAGHAEIAGIAGYAPSSIIIGSAEEAELAARNLHELGTDAKTALIAQTTIDEQKYFLIGQAIQKNFPGLEIIHTICPATTERQNSLRQLLEKVDALVIAGGRDSANTRGLALIADSHGTPYVLAESAADIPADFFAYDTVGLCAGASTPDSAVNEIELALGAHGDQIVHSLKCIL